MVQRDKTGSGAKRKLTDRSASKKTPRKKAKIKAAAKPKSVGSVTPEKRHRMISEVAFYKSERHGFGNNPFRDWVEAEAEINLMMSKSP